MSARAGRSARAARIPAAVVGAGRAGSGLAGRLSLCGYEIIGPLRRRQAAGAALARAVRRARLVLICVPDGEIIHVAHALTHLPLDGKVVLHTSGALGLEPLSALSARGASVGSLHPLVSFPPPGREVPPLRGITFVVEGDPAARRAAGAIVRAVGGRTLRLASSSRADYHLVASILANGLVSLIDSGLDLAARRLGLTEARARAAFLPLSLSALRNVSRLGSRRALTGPAARGDSGTIAMHLAALRRGGAARLELYRLLSLHAVAMAESSGRLDRRRAAALRRLLIRGPAAAH